MTASGERANGKQEPPKRWYGNPATLISLGAIGMALGAAVIHARASMSPEAAPASQAEHDTAADKAGPLIVRSLVAQVAVLLTIAAAGAYVDGVLVLCLKLEFRSFSWTWVLGQSSQDFILLTALGDVILPSLLIGFFIGPLILRRRRSRPRRGRYTRKRLAVSAFMVAAASALLAFPPPLILHAVTQPGVGNFWHAWLICFVINFCFIVLTLVILNWLFRDEFLGVEDPHFRQACMILVVAFAVTPLCASISAAFKFPDVTICTAAPGGHGLEHRSGGNLIVGTPSLDYVAVYHYENKTAGNRYIVSAPPSAVVIGTVRNCSGIP